MPFKKIVALLLFAQLVLSCEKVDISNSKAQIIPVPLSLSLEKGSFIIDNTVGISYPETLSVSANFLKSYINNGSAINLKSTNEIEFVMDANILNEEGYELEIRPEKILIKASTDRGAFYAVQSLRQLLPASVENGTFKENKIAIPCALIKDEPQFKYRGMHLDVGRHMYSAAFIKKYIDALAMLKMNTFHWHLTEDQGWRLEIKKYPRLQEVSAFRNETLIGHYSDQPHQFDGKKYGGFYTQDEVREIVAYAAERHVTVIPEIEMPGHSQAAIAAYPELGCSGENVEVAKKWGVFEHIYCTNDKTFAFLEDVLDEVLELFPSKYIHIGGDEAPKTQWKKCSRCQRRIKEEGLKDEHELQNYFITRIEKYLNSKGRQIIGWDEILEGGLAPNATVMSWRGTNGAVEAAKQQHNVVMTPTSHCYFDYYQSDNDDEPLAIGGFLPLEKVYHFNPIPEELTDQEASYVLGAQGNIWTEYMPTEAQVEYMAFPRMLAMSEVVWSPTTKKDYPNFVSRVELLNKRLKTLNINYANHLYEVEGELLTENGETKYKLNTLIKDKVIRLDLHGDEPTFESRAYTEPIVIDSSLSIKAAVFEFNGEKKLGNTFSQTIDYHKAVGKHITINKKPHKAYSGSGAEGLINGISGSDSRYGDKEWLGFWGDHLEITIDLGKETKVNSIETRFHNGQGQWIYAPKRVHVAYDNEPFKAYGLKDSDSVLVDFRLSFKKMATKIILRIPSYGTIPEGKQGAGNKAWTFIDEITIN